MTRHRVSLLLVAIMATLAVPFIATAQPEGEPSAEERRSPLPNYFGKIAVSDEQREQLYKVQDDYEDQIDALQQQIKALLKERDTKMEELLTPGQKLRLKELRDEARQRAAQKRAEAAKEGEN